MVDDKDSVQLAEYCFDVCEALKTATQGKNADDLGESVRTALEDSERCVHLGLDPVCIRTKQPQGYERNRADS